MLDKTHPLILAIESSCDETSAAVIANGKVLNNIIASQAIHHKYGGVVPELASREHQKNILHVVQQALDDARVSPAKLDAVAFTRGPGLMGSLVVGVSFAKGMALALDLPLIEVNHMEAHVLAHFIDDPQPAFPFLCLTVSGGHTQIVLVQSHLQMEVIGETRDDAVGEAFDKAAKMMGLPYPGGPLIDQYAQLGKPVFPFPNTQMPGYDFSFSGIKTALLYFLQHERSLDADFVTKNRNDICASLQKKLIEMLMNNLSRAASDLKINQVAIAGGVAANSGLRAAMNEYAKRYQWKIFIPEFQYCTDNAGMIAMAAHYKFLNNQFVDQDVAPIANLMIPSAS